MVVQDLSPDQFHCCSRTLNEQQTRLMMINRQLIVFASRDTWRLRCLAEYMKSSFAVVLSSAVLDQKQFDTGTGQL